MKTLQQIFDEMMAKNSQPFKMQVLEERENAKRLIMLGLLGELQDADTGNSLLHLVIKKLMQDEPALTQEQYECCIDMLLYLRFHPLCFSNMFLQNKEKQTAYDLLTQLIQKRSEHFLKGLYRYRPQNLLEKLALSSDFQIGRHMLTELKSKPSAFVSIVGRDFFNAYASKDNTTSATRTYCETLNNVAKGILPENLSHEIALRASYQPGHDAKPSPMLDLAALNGHTEFFNKALVACKLANDQNQDDINRYMPNVTITAELLLDETTFNTHPVSAYSNSVLNAFGVHGNTTTVQEIFRDKQRSLIRGALATYHDNSNDNKDPTVRVCAALSNLIAPDTSTRKIIRRSTTSSMFSNDTDTESYKLITNVLNANNSVEDLAVETALSELAVHADLPRLYCDIDSFSEQVFKMA